MASDPQSPGAGEKLPGIRHVIAIGSGKGGVGKSTVSVNLAYALQQQGAKVGLLDADILGPSIPGMLGIPAGQPPPSTPDGQAVPPEAHGLKAISMGMLTGDDSPAVLRGPMVSKYLRMFIGAVAWGELDYLLIDLPPGTGDIQLTLAQSIPLSGAVIVTTPQDVSLKIARRGLRMFERVQVPILGVVENMSSFTCPHCGKETDIFRRGGGERMSRELGVPFLGAIPLSADVVECGDAGRPVMVAQPESGPGLAYRAIAAELTARVEGLPGAGLKPFVWNWDDGAGAPPWPAKPPAAGGAATTPVGLRRRDARTLSVWWADGVQHDIDVRDLRLACHCALCVEEMTGRPLLDPATVRADVAPRSLMSVGNYAVAVTWNDGHNSGLDTFSRLRELGERGAARTVEDV
ncbi:MAG: P-loop NTPase [Chromatiales bacterium]|jgi:ATP-binding protein involved in chromosome partitioning|nr:P-loop NTPase [Chromatiales bacterium]